MDNICINLAIRVIKDGKESNLFDLHQQFRLTHKQAFDAVTYLEKLEIVNFDGKNFSLKKNAKSETLAAIYKLLKKRKLKLDEEDILMYKENSLPPSELYNPNLDQLDPSLLIDVLK